MPIKNLVCSNCGVSFDRHLRRNEEHKNYFCCSSCHKEFRAVNKPKPSGFCLNCKKPTSNPKFCNRSCSVSFNNRLDPKRKKSGKSLLNGSCRHCGVPVPSRSSICKACNPLLVDWNSVTYENLTGKRAYQKNSRIRNMARAIYNKLDGAKACVVCGYSTHYHVCHVKPISSFPEDTPISVINDPSNLIALCPNHHWELDNGLISIDDLVLRAGFKPATTKLEVLYSIP